jgi:hypothetical protein
MLRIQSGLTAVLVLGLAQVAAGGQETVDVDRLPVDMRRIERQLRQTMDREAHDGLNLQFFVGVFGQAPPIELFTKDDNLVNGPVPYGGPTHREVLETITPREYRAPAMDFGGLFRWMADKTKGNSPR